MIGFIVNNKVFNFIFAQVFDELAKVFWRMQSLTSHMPIAKNDIYHQILK